jgi:hypothetical protein
MNKIPVFFRLFLAILLTYLLRDSGESVKQLYASNESNVSQSILIADYVKETAKNTHSGLFYLYALDYKGERYEFPRKLLREAVISPNGEFIFAQDEAFDFVIFTSNGQIVQYYQLPNDIKSKLLFIGWLDSQRLVFIESSEGLFGFNSFYMIDFAKSEFSLELLYEVNELGIIKFYAASNVSLEGLNRILSFSNDFSSLITPQEASNQYFENPHFSDFEKNYRSFIVWNTRHSLIEPAYIVTDSYSVYYPYPPVYPPVWCPDNKTIVFVGTIDLIDTAMMVSVGFNQELLYVLPDDTDGYAMMPSIVECSLNSDKVGLFFTDSKGKSFLVMIDLKSKAQKIIGLDFRHPLGNNLFWSTNNRFVLIVNSTTEGDDVKLIDSFSGQILDVQFISSGAILGWISP